MTGTNWKHARNIPAVSEVSGSRDNLGIQDVRRMPARCRIMPIRSCPRKMSYSQHSPGAAPKAVESDGFLQKMPSMLRYGSRAKTKPHVAPAKIMTVHTSQLAAQSDWTWWDRHKGKL